MKLLFSVINDLSNFIKRETRIFLIMFIGLIVASFSLIYFYSFYTDNKMSKEELHITTQQYDIVFETDAAYKQKLELLHEIHNKNIFPDILQLKLTPKHDKEENITLIGCYSKREHFYIYEGRDLTDADQKEAKEVAVVCTYLLDYSNKISYAGEEFIIENKPYEIVGVAGFTDDDRSVYIPYTTYIKNKYDIKFMRIVFADRLSDMQEKRLEDSVKSIDPSARVVFPPAVDHDILAEYLGRMLVSTVIVLFAIINIVSLFKYWISQNIRKYSIYILCGAKHSFIFFMMIAESIFISLLAFLISIPPYILLSPVFKTYYLDYQVNALEYLLIATIIVVLTVGSVIIPAYRTAKKLNIKEI